jgi:GT2 family glycosyltransferase
LSAGLIDDHLEDPGTGLAGAINAGFRAMPESIDLINWLGDDDLLYPGSLTQAAKALNNHPEALMVFGSCDYIDPRGNIVWTNRSGQWAVPLLRFGPDLIPQPGALFRRQAFKAVGELSEKYSWAFDFDLFIKLSKLGKIMFIGSTLSAFRWHPKSLSVGFRSNSVLEASRVRVSHLPKLFRPLAQLWEFPVRQATLIAGSRVSAKTKRNELSR